MGETHAQALAQNPGAFFFFLLTSAHASASTPDESGPQPRIPDLQGGFHSIFTVTDMRAYLPVPFNAAPGRLVLVVLVVLCCAVLGAVVRCLVVAKKHGSTPLQHAHSTPTAHLAPFVQRCAGTHTQPEARHTAIQKSHCCTTLHLTSGLTYDTQGAKSCPPPTPPCTSTHPFEQMCAWGGTLGTSTAG